MFVNVKVYEMNMNIRYVIFFDVIVLNRINNTKSLCNTIDI